MQSAQQAEGLGYDWFGARTGLSSPGKSKLPILTAGSDIHCSARSPLLRAAHLLGFFGGLYGKGPVGDERYGHALPSPTLLGKDCGTIDHLSLGRFIMGVVSVGCRKSLLPWNAPFQERGKISDEQLQLLDTIWQQEHATFHGQHYNFDDIAFSPKPYQKPRIPIWIGGEGKLAQRRAGRYGDAWFPTSSE